MLVVNKLEVEGVSKLQYEELKSALASAEQNCLTKKTSSQLEGGRHGEPDLISLAVELSPVVLSVFALWLAKQKTRRTESFKFTKTDEKGSSVAIEFDRSSYSEGEISASAIEAFFKEV